MAVRIPQPGRQTSQQIAVWETGSWWTPRLQHRFSGSDVAVRGFRAAQDVVDASPAVVILDASDDPEGAVRNTAGVCLRHGSVFVIVIIPPELQAAEWQLRDIGAAVVVRNEIGGDELAAICRHALRTVPTDGLRSSSELI